jgi:hypothetical protein
MDAADFALMIPIVAIVMGIGFAMMALWLNYRGKRELFQLYHAQRMAAIEKGIDLPPPPAEIFEGLKPPAFPTSSVPAAQASMLAHLKRGLSLMLVGTVIFVALWFTAGYDVAWWGLIPAAVGLADLLFYFLAGRKLPTPGTPPAPGSQPEGTPPSDYRR